MIRLFVASFFLLVTVGCSATVKRQVDFSESQYVAYAQPGAGGIDAQVFMRTESGRVVTAAGQQIYCTPVTPYSTEFFQQSVLQGKTLDRPWVDASSKYFIVRTADADGRVHFRNLPQGDFYVWGNVVWKAYDSNKYVGVYDYQTGGVAYAIVHVDDGKVTEAIATR